MKNYKKYIIIIVTLVLILALSLWFAFSNGQNNNYLTLANNRKQNFGESGDTSTINSNTIAVEEADVKVTYTSSELATNTTSSATITLRDNDTSVDGNGVTVNGNTITITNGGTYYITGSLSDGSLVVNAKGSEVNLILAGVNIHCESSAPIFCQKADKIIITLAENTTNTLEDSASNSTTSSDEEQNGAIYSKADLTINGNGTLIVNANYQDGIVSKDGLKIVSGNISVNAADDGIRGKDYVAIKSGNITINASGDGIKSTNEDDTSLGYISIEGGHFTITSSNDAIQAETVLTISGGTFNLTSGGGSTNASKITTEDFRMGFQKIYANENSTDSSTSESMKGLKAGTQISISDGTFNINTADDAIHSNGIVVITNGKFTIAAGDDAIHADNQIKIDNGTIAINTSYEGIEASYIEINGGEISLVASDDGINVAGGKNGTNASTFFSSASSDRKLIINGGTIYVNANGDGLDANGAIYINGGYTVVDGPTSSGNGGLDYDSVCQITDGTLIITGSTGMLQTPSTSSTQYSISVIANGSANQKITLKDSTGTELLSFTPTKNYQSIIISSPQLKNGETYTLYSGSTEITSVTVNSIVSGTTGNGMMRWQYVRWQNEWWKYATKRKYTTRRNAKWWQTTK